MANKRTIKQAAKGKRNCDCRVRYSSLEPGDRVLVQNLTARGGVGGRQEGLQRTGRRRIRCQIARKGPNNPLYDLQPESGDGHCGVI